MRMCGSLTNKQNSQRSSIFRASGLYSVSGLQAFFDSDNLLEPYELRTLRDSSRSIASETRDVDVEESAIEGAALGVGDGGPSKLASGENRAEESGAEGMERRCFFVPLMNAEIDTSGLIGTNVIALFTLMERSTDLETREIDWTDSDRSSILRFADARGRLFTIFRNRSCDSSRVFEMISEALLRLLFVIARRCFALGKPR